jgi:hypothetical protein
MNTNIAMNCPRTLHACFEKIGAICRNTQLRRSLSRAIVHAYSRRLRFDECWDSRLAWKLMPFSNNTVFIGITPRLI